MNRAILAAAALLFAAPAHAQLIPAAPGSMWYGATWQLADQLDKDFAELSWATGGILFPCEEWSFNYGPPSPPIVPPSIEVDYVAPAPCLDCGPPPPCVACNPPPTAIPEISTYLMLLIGFVGICFLGQRRRA